MVIDMATAKITVTVGADQLKKIRQRVRKQKGQTVAGFVRQAVAAALAQADEAAWLAMLEESLEKTGGPLTDEEKEWADAVLTGKRPGKSPKRRKAA